MITTVLKLFFGAVVGIIIGFFLLIIISNWLKRRKYKGKYQAVLQHVLGLDFPLYANCNVFANEEGLVFVSEGQEQRLPAELLKRIENYTEHDMRGRAHREGVQISSLDGLVRNVPRGNPDKDLHVLVINYVKKPEANDIQVIGLVGDNPMHILDIFSKGTNKMYGLVTLVEEKKFQLEIPPEDDE